MFKVVVIVLKSTSRVVGWIDVNALYLALVKRKKGFKRNEVVPVNDEVVFSSLGIPVHGLSFEKMKGNFGGRSPRGIVINPMQ